MNIEITKELLGEVLGVDIRKINYSILDGNLYYYKTFIKCKSKINIHELEHKFKEWAFDNFYLSIIVFKINDDLYKCEIADIKDSLGEWNTKHSFKIETEIEAVIKACQWIFNKNRRIK